MNTAQKKMALVSTQWILFATVVLSSGCAMKGELRRCYGLALPLVKIGFCDVVKEQPAAPAPAKARR